MTRATALAAYLLDSAAFWFGVSAGLCVAAVVLAVVTLVDAVRERRARRAATAYRGKRRAPRRPVTAVRQAREGDTAPMPAVRAPSPHGHPRPVPPWAGRAERPGLMARLGGWHR